MSDLYPNQLDTITDPADKPDDTITDDDLLALVAALLLTA